MSDPTVCCILLTRDRPELARRAVECFRVQTYNPERRALIIWDTGEPDWYSKDGLISDNEYYYAAPKEGLTIGALRNKANAEAGDDVIIHWDDDDWSHPNRIDEQVELLESIGADCVGYRECLFWRDGARAGVHTIPGEAWLYSVPMHWPMGASMCYWRRAWEARPFPDLPTPGNPEGEDVKWRRGMKCVAVSAIVRNPVNPWANLVDSPRMICRIHGANTVDYAKQFTDPQAREAWTRVPGWDERCREIMT